VAIKSWDFNAEQLLTRNCIPYTDIVHRASSKEVRIACWEGNTINPFMMTGVSKLGLNLVGVTPIKGGFGCAREKVCTVRSKGNACYSTHNLSLTLDEHVVDTNFCDCTITRSRKKITVVKKCQYIDTLLEKTLCRSNPLVKATFEIDLDNVASKGAQVGRGVSGVYHEALEFAFDLAHVNVLVSNLLCYEVTCPDAESVVVDGDKFVVSRVEEANLVGNIHAHRSAAKSFASFNLPDHELVVILAAK